MIDKNFDKSINDADALAASMSHQYVSLEHLFRALLDNPEAVNLLNRCGASIDILKREIEYYLNSRYKDEMHRTRRIGPPTISNAVWDIKDKAQTFAGNQRPATGAHAIAAFYLRANSPSVECLLMQKVTRSKIMKFLATELAENMQVFAEPQTQQSVSVTIASHTNEEDFSRRSPLEQFTTNLNDKARAGRVIPLVGRDEELENVIEVLCQTRKNNPLLLGEPGVGKTAIAEGLAWMIVNSIVPPVISHLEIFELDLGSIMADTKYRGEFEKRIQGLLNEIKTRKGAVLFIDEIHMIVGAGSTGGNAMDLANYIKPMLASGELSCIGATTYKEYRNNIEKDAALTRRFQVVDIPSPTPEQTVAILEGIKKRFEKRYEATYTHKAIRLAVELTDKYMPNANFPDKAIDIIDQAGAQYQLYMDERHTDVIDEDDIRKVVAKKTKIPMENLKNQDQSDSLRNLEENLKAVIYGQDQAIESIARHIKLSKSGLCESDKPIGSFLFAGPTGVGKTELCKQVAEHLDIKLIRFDMSEYMERHAVSKLIGTPPGYVGYDQPGALTDAVGKNPHCLLLLDEIEKAHPDISNILLQVMDHGRLTDSMGKVVDFTQAIVVLTTNAGAESYSKKSIGFTSQSHDDEATQGLERAFSPELRNRLDAVVNFVPLDRSVIHHVVDKFIRQLQSQLEAKSVTLEVDEKARDWFAEKGYDRNMGARPMRRLIQESLKQTLADELLFGRLVEGGQVVVTIQDDALEMIFE